MPRINNPYERRHIAHLAQYAKQIDAIYRTAVQEAAAIAALISDFESSRVFSFNDYPITHQRIQSLLSRLNKSTETAIVNGINAEWTLANNKNNELSQLVFGNNTGRLTPAQYRRYFSTNDNARQAFLQRKEQGLNLSERVWQYTNAFRREIELGLDIGLRNGLSADEMSRELRQYLKYPDKLFRRVRDEHGNLVLSKRAAEFHPGQGVYRSSYKNARRLAVTETNIAYRTADYERYQQLDFVVGIEIRLSNNHTCNGLPLYDICDELCGRYPKDFKFTGWHPHCRCHVVSILKTEEELMRENEAILAGKEPTEESVNRVADVPQNFRDWVKNNADRIKNARSIPYFMKDNGTIEKGLFTLKEFGKQSVLVETSGTAGMSDLDNEIAARRGLMQLWDARMKGWLNMEIDLDDIDNDIELGDLDIANARIQTLLKSVERHENRTSDDIRRIQDLADERRYGNAYVENVHKIENALGIKRGKRMTHEQANTGRVNPNYGQKGFGDNCSTCSATYILRTMGLNVEAKANIVANPKVQALSQGMETWRKWENGEAAHISMKSWMDAKGYSRMTAARYTDFIKETVTEEGIYEFNVGYKGHGGHSTLIRRLKDGTIELIEQQTTSRKTLAQLLNELTATPHQIKYKGKVYPSEVRGIMRVDTARFNWLYADIVKIVK